MSVREAFRGWLAEQPSQVVSRIAIGPEADRGLEFGFPGWPALGGYLHQDELIIAVTWKGECFDFLLSLDVAPEPSPGGWVCGIWEGEYKRLWPTLEALWRDHLFDPVGLWIEQDLGKAIGLTLHRVGGTTWARLTHDIDDMTGDSLVMAIAPEVS